MYINFWVVLYFLLFGFLGENMLDNEISDYYTGITKKGEKLFISYVRKDVWKAFMISERYEFVSDSGYSSIDDDFEIEYVRPICPSEILGTQRCDIEIKWCYEESKSIKNGKADLDYLIRGYSNGLGINYCIKLDKDFKFIVYIESQKDTLFIADSFEEAKSWCEQNVLEKMGYKSDT